MAEKIGLIAGSGELPSVIAAAALSSGKEVYVAALSGITDLDTLVSVPHDVYKLGQCGKILKAFRKEKVTDVLFIGGVRRPSFKELSLDWWTARHIAKWGFSIFGDDSLLMKIVKIAEAEGFKVIGAQDVLPELVSVKGVYGKIKPDKQAEIDIARGHEVAKGIGSMDIGQSVVVQQGMVIGVEAIEGTDALIRRCKTLQRGGVGGVLVKTCKPSQERRIDLPTIGVNTVTNAKEAGLRGIAVEAGSSLIVGVDDVIKTADNLGLFIIGI